MAKQSAKQYVLSVYPNAKVAKKMRISTKNRFLKEPYWLVHDAQNGHFWLGEGDSTANAWLKAKEIIDKSK